MHQRMIVTLGREIIRETLIFASHFNYMLVGRASDSMKGPAKGYYIKFVWVRFIMNAVWSTRIHDNWYLYSLTIRLNKAVFTVVHVQTKDFSSAKVETFGNLV